MKKIDAKFTPFGVSLSYKDILESFECKMLYYNEFDKIIAILLGNDNKFGLFFISKGTFTLCDPLQHCSTDKDIENLQQEILNSGKWFSSAQELTDYINNLSEHDFVFNGLDQYICNDIGNIFGISSILGLNDSQILLGKINYRNYLIFDKNLEKFYVYKFNRLKFEKVYVYVDYGDYVEDSVSLEDVASFWELD